MKAAVLHGNEDLRFEEFPDPVVGAGDVLIRVMRTGICGSDIPRVLRHGAHFYPIVLGHEFSGVVVDRGRGVQDIPLGSRVAGAPLLPCGTCADCQRGDFALCKHYSFIGSRAQGSFAEYVALPARNAVVFDDAIPFEQGALFEPSAVALHGALLAGNFGGASVVVLGGGTIGLLAAQWARILGARWVTVLDLDPDRLALGLDLGADAALSTLAEDYEAQALAFTQGQGYDIALETSGAEATLQMALRLTGSGAHAVFIGTPTRAVTFTPAQWEQINRKELRLTGSWMSYSAPFPGKEWAWTAHYFKTQQLHFDPRLIFRTFPLHQAAEAFLLYKTPGIAKGRVMLSPSAE
jgi:L-iditol 2-dehydrogenase